MQPLTAYGSGPATLNGALPFATAVTHYMWAAWPMALVYIWSYLVANQYVLNAIALAINWNKLGNQLEIHYFNHYY